MKRIHYNEQSIVSSQVEGGKRLSAVQAVQASADDQPFAVGLSVGIGLKAPQALDAHRLQVQVKGNLPLRLGGHGADEKSPQ